MTDAAIHQRLQTLLDEGQRLRGVKDARGDDHPAFEAWRQRAQSAIEDKLGADSRPAREFAKLRFYYFQAVWSDPTPSPTPTQHQAAFNSALDDALALLAAAIESNPRSSGAASAPLVKIDQIGPTAVAPASAEMHINVTIEQLRQLVASEPGLSPQDRARAMEALPDDPSELTIEKVEKLLDVASTGKGLFKPLLGWLIAQAQPHPLAILNRTKPLAALAASPVKGLRGSAPAASPAILQTGALVRAPGCAKR